MLKLAFKTEPTWLEIGGGVRVKVPPLTPAVLRASEYLSWKTYSAVKAVANGGDDTVELPQKEIARLEGVFALARIRALCDVIEAWEGVADEKGHGLPLSDEALDAFASHPIAGPAFAQAYDRTIAPLVAEGNGSPSSSGGDGAAAIAIAPDASTVEEGDAPPAPASAMPLKARKA
jgi:hypothetical protein